MRIVNNPSSLNAWRNLFMTDHSLSKSLERLSSGFRINRSADDAAGLAISENMRAQVRGFNQAVRNAQDGISLVQTAEGSLNEVHSILQRMRELAVQAANGTLQPEDRLRIQSEFDNLTMEITRITNASKFNNKDLIDGSLISTNISDVTLQIGPNSGQNMTFEVGAMDADTLALGRNVLVGIVDNGTSSTNNLVSFGGANGLSATVTSTTGLASTSQYRVYVDATLNTFTLQENNGTSWADVAAGTAAAAGALTLGNVGVEEIQVTGLTADPTVTGYYYLNRTNIATVSNSVTSVSETGAGITSGEYTVRYDAGTNTVQLWNAANDTAIGERVGFVAGSTVTIGDANTAQTMKVVLNDYAPTSSTTDNLRIGSMIGEVAVDQPGATGIIAASDGVTNVGYGLTAGSYTVQLVQAAGTDTLQLFDSNGLAVGSAVSSSATGFINGDTVSIGDSASGRTVSITLRNVSGGGAVANGTYNSTISITNNGKSSEEAKFYGGVKTQDARVYAGLNVSSQTGASTALTVIDTAISEVSRLRSELGAIQNRLEHTINNLQVVSENLVSAESRIRDVDMALEMSQFTKNQILMQSGTAMLAQANAKNQAVLSLLQ